MAVVRNMVQWWYQERCENNWLGKFHLAYFFLLTLYHVISQIALKNKWQLKVCLETYVYFIRGRSKISMTLDNLNWQKIFCLSVIKTPSLSILAFHWMWSVTLFLLILQTTRFLQKCNNKNLIVLKQLLFEVVIFVNIKLNHIISDTSHEST